MERRIFNHPIRKETTQEFFPDKIDIDDFQSLICENFNAFKENMLSLQGVAIENKYAEEWVEQYLAWLEIEEER